MDGTTDDSVVRAYLERQHRHQPGGRGSKGLVQADEDTMKRSR
jgi:hypothetical protein